MKKLKQAKSVFASNKDVSALCVTSDGSVFNTDKISFATAHAQRFDDKSVVVVGRDGKFKKENEKFFFKGSNITFQLLSAKEAPANEDEKPKEDEPKADDQPNDDQPQEDEKQAENAPEDTEAIANDEMSVKVLKSMAKTLDGYKSSMNKAELIALLNAK